MTNPFSALIGEAREIIIGTLVVVVFLVISGTLATIPGATPEVKQVAEQGQEAISYAWILYLGLPSLAVIGIIIWAVKKFTKPESIY